MFDTKRSVFNVANDGLIASGNNTEYTDNNTFKIDILSNGFKVRNSDSALKCNKWHIHFCGVCRKPFSRN